MKPSRAVLQKQQMRSQFRERLAQMSLKARKSQSAAVLKKLFKDKRFQKAGILFTYMALPQEVQTASLIRKALGLGKKVFAPKMKRGSSHFEICEIRNTAKAFKKGRYGVLEPQSGKKIDCRKLELIIVPGLAFDKKGNRLGRGKGYFDRFLEKVRKTPKIGLAFKEQMAKKIPVQAHDVVMDRVITG